VIPALIAVGVVVLVALCWLVLTYNSLVNLRNLIRESWSDVETELKRRHDLIPRLVETVKGYARHEHRVFEEVTRARAQAMDAISHSGGAKEQGNRETELSRSLKGLFAVAERYPDLKASENFLHLQKELVNTEDRIQAARRFFNGNVRDYNNKVQMFPSSMIAGAFKFRSAEFFEIEQTEAAPPRVEMT